MLGKVAGAVVAVLLVSLVSKTVDAQRSVSKPSYVTSVKPTKTLCDNIGLVACCGSVFNYSAELYPCDVKNNRDPLEFRLQAVNVSSAKLQWFIS